MLPAQTDPTTIPEIVGRGATVTFTIPFMVVGVQKPFVAVIENTSLETNVPDGTTNDSAAPVPIWIIPVGLPFLITS